MLDSQLPPLAQKCYEKAVQSKLAQIRNNLRVERSLFLCFHKSIIRQSLSTDFVPLFDIGSHIQRQEEIFESLNNWDVFFCTELCTNNWQMPLRKSIGKFAGNEQISAR